MKKIFFLPIVFAFTLVSQAQILEIDGVPILTDFYSHQMSIDGTQIVGESEDGSTVYYNIPENKFYNYEYCSFGRGYVIADNGTIVGSLLMDTEAQSTAGVIMKDGKITNPSVFDSYITSNIHSITPDASRVCGVVGNSGRGMSNLPYYCDMDENGNLGELKFLPTPEKDFFGNHPQYCSATWISEDGKTIAGQVIDARGFYVYPIIYRENEEGVWSYSLPSESLFNRDKLPLPEPLGDFDQEYPNLEYPEPTQFMDPSQLEKWDEAYLIWETNNFAENLSPYNNLDLFMTDEEISAYLDAVYKYNEAVEEYNEKNEAFWEQVYKIVDCSVFFERNLMALSPNGKWLTAARYYEDTSGLVYDNIMVTYIPYLFNLGTGEITQIADDKVNLGVNQAFNNGDVICASPVASVLPPRSWLYKHSSNELISIEDYVKSVNSFYGNWFEENLSGYIPVAENEDGTFEYQFATITGLVSASEDLTVICGGVLGYAINLDMYLSYLFNGLPSGVESIEVEQPSDNVYNVFNLQGVKVMTTKDPSSLKDLSKGVYIVNGKKVLITK